MTSLELNQSMGLNLKRAEHFNLFIDVFITFLRDRASIKIMIILKFNEAFRRSSVTIKMDHTLGIKNNFWNSNWLQIIRNIDQRKILRFIDKKCFQFTCRFVDDRKCKKMTKIDYYYQISRQVSWWGHQKRVVHAELFNIAHLSTLSSFSIRSLSKVSFLQFFYFVWLTRGAFKLFI